MCIFVLRKRGKEIVQLTVVFFFLEHAGELLILRRKRGKSPYSTHPHTNTHKRVDKSFAPYAYNKSDLVTVVLLTL
jgi:hypothetical protein